MPLNEMERKILEFHDLTASQQGEYTKNHPLEVISMFWYICGYSGLIKKLEKEKAKSK